VQLAAQATKRVFAFLEEKLALSEHEGAGKGPWLMLAGRSTRGALRCFGAPGLDKLVLITLEDSEQLDASMLLAFGAPDSALPHLVIDVARVGRDFGVFVDLVPRVDLALNPAYARGVYSPLRGALDGLSKNPQLRASPVPGSLRPFVSPWMTGFRLNSIVLPQLFELLTPILSHWVALHAGAVPPVALSVGGLTARDLAHRTNLFSKDADPVWDVLARAVGDARAGRVLGLLRNHGVAAPMLSKDTLSGFEDPPTR
jgi:hypothetical protein